MAAFDLAEPTVAHFHFAIGGTVGAIANDEVISEAILHSAPAMGGIKNLRVAIARGAFFHLVVLMRGLLIVVSGNEAYCTRK